MARLRLCRLAASRVGVNVTPSRPRAASATARVPRQGVQCSPGQRVDRATERRGAHAESPSLQQLIANPPLQALNALRGRRLRQLQRVGGALNAAALNRRRKRGQLAARQRVSV
jgi:hypothetical protein